jgi:hypothetical protein
METTAADFKRGRAIAGADQAASSGFLARIA